MTIKTVDERFVGNKSLRLPKNPQEALILERWKKFLGKDPDSVLTQILGKNPGDDLDWKTVTTLIQWLATPVGEGFLESAGYKRSRAE